jgi:CTP:molybdopterin cytidylyltransferase MocA
MENIEKPQGKVGAIIVAAGESRRMMGVDKLFAPLAGKPVLILLISARALTALSLCSVSVTSNRLKT